MKRRLLVSVLDAVGMALPTMVLFAMISFTAWMNWWI